jgi:DNA mismatch repair protein MutL
MSVSVRRIRALSALVASQIAAGEVVERPASVVKELVENSIDAGATAISVELEAGGTELVRVTDNGGGIEREDLPLAVMPHATSKIAETSDLDRIATLGFRGEALASIASVARVSIRSRTAGEVGAWVLETEGTVEGLSAKDVKPAAGAVGTSIAVRNLFFNTPARRKFLRTVPTEQSRCVDAVTELALAHPAVAFRCVCDGRTVLDLPGDQTARDRALDVLGRELKDQLLEVHADQYDDARGVAVWGLVGLPAIARATRAAQHLFVNGRSVRDRTVQHALSEPFRGLIEPGRHPTALLMLEMSPEAVDVNVHPQKAEVRFRDSGVVHSVVFHAVKRALAGADLTPTFAAISPAGARFGEERAVIGPGAVGGGAVVEAGGAARAKFVDYFKRFGPGMAQGRLLEGAESRSGISDFRSQTTDTKPGISDVGSEIPTHDTGVQTHPVIIRTEPSLVNAPTPAAKVLQVHNSYLVTQDAQGVLIVDQHALHERVMFEALLARVTETDLESQRLLTPIVLDATPTQIARLDELGPLLARIGIEAAAMGPRQVAVHAFPSFLFERNVDPGEFLPDLFEKAAGSDFAPGSEDALRDVLDMMACKAAVKAGDRMSDGELSTLMDLRDAVERSSNCPHGRPTTVRLTIKELEKLFGRA